MAPGLRELIALPLLAVLGCGFALAHGDLLFVAVFSSDWRQVLRNSSQMPFVYFGMLANRSRWRDASVDPSLIALSYHSRA
jgi:hypothetical protein